MGNYSIQAEDFVKTNYGPEFSIVKSSIQDLPDLFCFTFQSVQYLESRNLEDLAVGSGYNFIQKSNNRVFSYGSGHGFDEALDITRAKIRQEEYINDIIPEFDIQKHYNLRILKVHKNQMLLDVLLKYKLTYVVPDVVGNTIYRVLKTYKKNLLTEKLSNTPVTFHGINQNVLPEMIIAISTNSSCEFEIVEYADRNFVNYLDKATDEDLATIW
ncbi:hypothetical protein K6119_04265 [Paracrocinitomix mangrovi]|uniref:hypothetical protein n=1 Tax=Paracrocinitomix mangrovi TaxID=2862509 RepID=UPI001C8D4703|nr:hypothetical protein [Paracrocinitomix mangrovi]UKN02728.1 hypothetical protein K6119_04265 [Paracrocinitomix mangrovi]